MENATLVFHMEKFEMFPWNFLTSTNSEIGRSDCQIGHLEIVEIATKNMHTNLFLLLQKTLKTASLIKNCAKRKPTCLAFILSMSKTNFRS